MLEENLPKANNKTLLKNTGIIAIGTTSTKMINFLLLPMYTALISTEEYGTIDLLSTYVTLLMAIASLQIYQAVFRFVAVEREDFGKVKTVLSTLYAITIGGLVVYSGLCLLIFPLVSLPYKWYLLVQVVANVYLSMVTNSVRGLGYNASYAFANFLSASISLALNVLFLVVFRWPAMTMLWAYILGPVVGGTVAFIYKRMWRFLDPRAINLQSVGKYLRYALPLIPNELSWWVVHASDRTIVSAFLGVAANGLIAVASKFSSIYSTIFSVFNTAWTEQCVLHFDEEGGCGYLAKTMVTVTKLFSGLTLLLIAFMPLAFSILVNRQYAEAYGLVPIYLMAVFFNVLIGLVSPIYLINNETGKVAKSTAVAAIINIGVDLLLIGPVGVYAAPVSSLCAYLVVSVWRVWDAQRRYLEIPFSRMYLVRCLAMLIVVCAGYYSQIVLLQIPCALLAIVYVCLENRAILAKAVALVQTKLPIGQ